MDNIKDKWLIKEVTGLLNLSAVKKDKNYYLILIDYNGSTIN